MGFLVKQGGVLEPQDFVVTPTSTPSMNVLVSSGRAIFRTSGQADPNVYKWFVSDSNEVVSIASANTQPRIDIVCLRIDPITKTAFIESSGVNNAFRGTPSSSPIPPATPAHCYKLAEVYVPANATSITENLIRDTREFLYGYDGIPVQNPIVSHGSFEKQLLLNGDFRIWQDANSYTIPPANSFNSVLTADRWFFNVVPNSGGTTPSITIERETPSLSHYGESLPVITGIRMTTNGTGSGLGTNSEAYLLQRIEGGTLIARNYRKFTLSFYAKTSLSSQTIGAQVVFALGTGGGSPLVVNTNNFTLRNWFRRYEFVLDVPVNHNTVIMPDAHIEVRFFLHHHNAGVFFQPGNVSTHITAVQLNMGEGSLGFHTRSFAEELYLCRRYRLVFGTGVNGSFIHSDVAQLGYVFPVTLYSTNINFVVRQSTLPITVTDGLSTITSSATGIILHHMGAHGCTFDIGGFTGHTPLRPIRGRRDNFTIHTYF
jgi:hypothetical protein